jgi:transglutaminase-like putative cysteine protease
MLNVHPSRAGDIGVPAEGSPMDFSAWFEVFLGGRWHTFDARHNMPQIGHILIAGGRDAADVAISTAFGASKLRAFSVTKARAPRWEESKRNSTTWGRLHCAIGF